MPLSVEKYCVRKVRAVKKIRIYIYTLIFPKRFAIEDATSMEPAEMILVVKKREPSFPSSMPNF